MDDIPTSAGALKEAHRKHRLALHLAARNLTAEPSLAPRYSRREGDAIVPDTFTVTCGCPRKREFKTTLVQLDRMPFEPGCNWCLNKRNARARAALDDAQAILERRGYTPTILPVSALTEKHVVTCPHGHTSTYSLAVLASGKFKCEECMQITEDTGLPTPREEFFDKVAEKGGTVLGTYRNMRIPLKVTCAAGHTWTPRPQNIMAGHWCPECCYLERNKKHG